MNYKNLEASDLKRSNEAEERGSLRPVRRARIRTRSCLAQTPRERICRATIIGGPVP